MDIQTFFRKSRRLFYSRFSFCVAFFREFLYHMAANVGSLLTTVDLAPFLVDEGVVIGESATEGQRASALSIHIACKG